MAIRVLFATAHRQTLTIQHENPFGDCFTEYDLDEYTPRTRRRRAANHS
ncbi:MAG: hypothetical protein ACLUI3_00055 [Christensenellales bacterium]